MTGERDPQDDTTLVTCLACGGNWQRVYETAHGYRMVACHWCLNGSMSAKQIAKWKARKKP